MSVIEDICTCGAGLSPCHGANCPVWAHFARKTLRGADPAETGIHHVGWDLHAQRGTKPYDDSDTTGTTW